MLFVEGNHFCPSCEKSGNCELQGLAYRYKMFVPRFPYLWPKMAVNGDSPKIIHESNRCIKCQRCIRGLLSQDGKHVFGLVNRGNETRVLIDMEQAEKMTDAQAEYAMSLCPVGAIICKEIGFKVPIGNRKFDHKPIGSDIEE